MNSFNNNEEHRYNEDLEYSCRKHAEYYSNTHFRTGIRTCTSRKCQRNVAEDECQGSHQNRAQTNLRCFDGSLHDIHAIINTDFRVLDDQDGVLRSQPDDGQETDLEVNVVIYMECHGCQARAKETSRYPEDDREWNLPAFIESCQRQEYEEHAEREGIYCLTARFTFLGRGFDEFEAITIRKYLIGGFFERIERLPGGVSILLLPADLDGREVVVTSDDGDRIGFLRSDKGGDRHHIALIVANRQELVVPRVRAVLGIRLRDDLEVTAINGEIIDLDRAIVGLKSGEDIPDSHTISLCFSRSIS